MDIRIMLERWIKGLGRSDETKRKYKEAVNLFIDVSNFPNGFSTESLTLDHYISFLEWLTKNFPDTPNTQAVYSIGVARFFGHLFLLNLSPVNPEKIRAAKKELTIQVKYSIPQFSMDDIETILESSDSFIEHLFDDEKAKLRAFRDRAFLLTLADTGLRVHEACKLRRGMVDLNEGQAVIIGKGRKQAMIRFSPRSISAIKDYLSLRAILDGGTGKPLSALPIFAQHSRSSGSKVKSITTETGRAIIKEWVTVVLGEQKVGEITPHSFRHYFVTTVLRATGNLKLAQGLARHESIVVTERYAHLSNKELDQGYYEIFGKKEK